MEKIINKLINESTKGVDTYSHNGSTWLIFTESKQWAIELTESKTLWYNFNFFKNLFAYASLEVVQNQHLITKWVEDNVMNGSKYTSSPSQTPSYNLTEVFENRIKETCWNPEDNTSWVKGVIKGGVKETRPEHNITEGEVDDIIQDGVKNIMPGNTNHFGLEDAIQNGIKETKISPTYTEYGDWLDGDERLDDIIDNGVKLTLKLESREYTGDIDDTLENGVKETIECDWSVPKSVINEVINEGVKSSIPRQYVGKDIIDKIIDKVVIETHDDVYHHKGRIDGVIKNGVKEIYHYKGFRPRNIGDIIKNGVKETQPLPDQSGELIGYGNYYNLKEDRTKAFIDYLEETIEKGVKIN